MATVTKTYTDNSYYSAAYRKTWTVNYIFEDIIASGSTFVFNTPTITAKFVGNGVYRNTELSLSYPRINGVSVGGTGGSSRYIWKTPNSSAYIQGASNALFTMSKGGTSEYDRVTSYSHDAITLNTADFFKATNKTQRSLDVTFEFSHYTRLRTDTQSDGLGRFSMYIYDSDDPEQRYTLGTVTLNAPPTATLGTPTYATPQYVGLGAYTVPITSAEAYYGGDISKVTLTVGQDSTVQTYSTPTISNQTISVTPTMAGTYTPTVTIEDSRGQIATYTLPQITVNPYNVPSVSFDVYRTNNIGIKNDEGHYALIQSTISYTDAIATLTEPSIQIDGVDLSSLANASVTWYKTWSNTSGVSNVISNWTTLVPQNHTVTIYGLIDWKYSTTGNFAEDTSYQITLVANDSLNGHSTPITQTMSTAFYTIDFQAGGKEIAFGAPANDNLTSHPNGLFKCAMDAQFGGNAKFDGNVGFDGDVEFGGNVVGIRGSVIGEIKAYAGLSIPDGWLECDGSEVSKTEYPNLYAAIGDLWGTPNSSSNFKLPNFNGRVLVGHDSTDEDFGTVGGTGGAKSRELCAAIGACNDGPSTLGYIAEAMTSYQSSHGASYVVRGSKFESMRNWNHSTPVTERNSSSRATSFLPPYAVIKYIICAF